MNCLPLQDEWWHCWQRHHSLGNRNKAWYVYHRHVAPHLWQEKNLICCKVPLRGRDVSWRLYSLENNRTDGDEIEYGYPITCGDSRAVLLFKKFVCPGINVRCVKVSWLRFVDNSFFPFQIYLLRHLHCVELCHLPLYFSFISIQDCDCL